MTRERIHDLMENELRCVQRGNYCDRDCAKCPLVKDDKELIEAYGYVIKALEQEPKWIPVSERLPEDGTWNLFTDGKAVSIERYKSDAIDHFYPNGRWFSLEEAVAWMPSPKPYKVETKAEDVSMNTCDNCIHCEMCRWINEVERDGCDFWDGNQKEEAIEEIRQAAEGLLRFARTGISLENADEADRYLKTLANAFLHHSWNADKRQQ